MANVKDTEIKLEDTAPEAAEGAGSGATTDDAVPLEVGTANRPRMSVNALVRGVDVELSNTLTGVVIAGDQVEIERGIARSVFAGGAVEIERAGAGMIVGGGDTSIRQGGAGTILSAGGITMEQAGSILAVARRIRIGHGGTTFLALTPQIEVQEGGRVVFGRAASLAIVGGVAALAALLVALIRGRPGAPR